MLIGYRVSQCLYVATKLGIAEHLASGARSSAELAERTGAHGPTLLRLLRALACFEIVQEVEGDAFALTAAGELLCSDAAGSVRREVLYHAHAACWQPWGRLLDAVRTGEPSFERVFHTDAWDYRAEHPEVNELFNDAMEAHSAQQRDVILSHADLSDVRSVVDVGGGTGALVAALLAQNEHLRAILFDQAHVVSGAAAVLRAAGVEDRCELASGSFLESIPPGGDLYILKAVLHNWNDERARIILGNCRAAMGTGARLLVVEWLLQPAMASRGVLLDLHMLVILGGRERTAAEYESLLSSAGFEPSKVTNTISGFSLIEATAA
jgi:precorrin-6B methylase 2